MICPSVYNTYITLIKLLITITIIAFIKWHFSVLSERLCRIRFTVEHKSLEQRMKLEIAKFTVFHGLIWVKFSKNIVTRCHLQIYKKKSLKQHLKRIISNLKHCSELLLDIILITRFHFYSLHFRKDFDLEPIQSFSESSKVFQVKVDRNFVKNSTFLQRTFTFLLCDIKIFRGINRFKHHKTLLLKAFSLVSCCLEYFYLQPYPRYL